MALLRANAARAPVWRAAARPTYGCYGRPRALSHSSVSASVRRGDPLPEDPTPAMWQRMAQLVAGTTATGTLVYFVLLADFGEGEHCFSPVCALLSDQTQIRRALAPVWQKLVPSPV